MTDFATARFERSPDGAFEAYIRKTTYITSEGFGTSGSTYPATVTPARYSGTYEGAPWLAFPVPPHRLGEKAWTGWTGSDIECSVWWQRAADEEWPIGLGHTPDEAYQNLVKVIASKAGLSLEDWHSEPTWDKDELKRRHDIPE